MKIKYTVGRDPTPDLILTIALVALVGVVLAIIVSAVRQPAVEGAPGKYLDIQIVSETLPYDMQECQVSRSGEGALGICGREGSPRFALVKAPGDGTASVQIFYLDGSAPVPAVQQRGVSD